jgi:hypothetical protein
MTVIFPKTPIIIAINLNARNGRRILLDTGCKIAEVFAIAILHVDIKKRVPFMFEGFLIISRYVLCE